MKHWQLLNITTCINDIPPSADSGSAVSNTVPCYDLSVFLFPLLSATSPAERPVLSWLNWFCPLTVPTRSQHSAAATRACRPGLYPRQNQQDGGASAQLVCFHPVSAGDSILKVTTTERSRVFIYLLFFYFLIPAFWSAAEQKAWSQRNASFYFWKVVIKWSVFSCSWTCCTRKLCTRWSTGWECLHQSKSKVKRSCLPTCSRYLSIHPSFLPSPHHQGHITHQPISWAQLNLCHHHWWSRASRCYLLCRL